MVCVHRTRSIWHRIHRRGSICVRDGVLVGIQHRSAAHDNAETRLGYIWVGAGQHRGRFVGRVSTAAAAWTTTWTTVRATRIGSALQWGLRSRSWPVVVAAAASARPLRVRGSPARESPGLSVTTLLFSSAAVAAVGPGALGVTDFVVLLFVDLDNRRSSQRHASILVHVGIPVRAIRPREVEGWIITSGSVLTAGIRAARVLETETAVGTGHVPQVKVDHWTALQQGIGGGSRGNNRKWGRVGGIGGGCSVTGRVRIVAILGALGVNRDDGDLVVVG